MTWNAEGSVILAGMYRVWTSSEMAARKPLREVVKGVFPQKGVAVIWGEPEGGKSFIALDMAAAIAEGREWFGRRVIRTPVIYVALEGVEGFGKRVAAWQTHNNRKMPDSIGFVTGERVTGSTEPNGFSLAAVANITQLFMSVKAHGAMGGVVIIDTLNRASTGLDENSSDGMGLIINGLHQMQSLLDGLVIAVHHPGKDASRGMRGHSSLLGSLDASLEVSAADGVRSWTPGKNKDNGKGAPEGFDLTVVDIGVDEDGDLISSCVITPTGEVARGKAPQPRGEWQKLVFVTLSMLVKAKGDIYADPQSEGAPVITQEAAMQACVDADQTKNARAREMVRRAIAAMIMAGILGGNYRHVWFKV